MSATEIRHDWTHAEVAELYNLPFTELLFKAQVVHRHYFNPNEVQISTLLNFKTGGCPEDCGYCSQSVHYQTGVEREAAMSVEAVLEVAKRAKEQGATRFCLAAAWRTPKQRDLDLTIEMVKGIKALGLEACATLGMLKEGQAEQLKAAGLDYYNHNLDTSPEFYDRIITSRIYQDRLDTLQRVREVGMKVCTGGILGMGETKADRVSLLVQLATMPEHPQSVPINQLVVIKGTRLEEQEPLDPIEFIRTVAVARLLMPKAMLRLSGGRVQMSDEMQAICFLAGANSIHYGEKLLTTPNVDKDRDLQLFKRLGLNFLIPQGTCAC